jgi:hypothetical protein
MRRSATNGHQLLLGGPVSQQESPAGAWSEDLAPSLQRAGLPDTATALAYWLCPEKGKMKNRDEIGAVLEQATNAGLRTQFLGLLRGAHDYLAESRMASKSQLEILREFFDVKHAAQVRSQEQETRRHTQETVEADKPAPPPRQRQAQNVEHGAKVDAFLSAQEFLDRVAGKPEKPNLLKMDPLRITWYCKALLTGNTKAASDEVKRSYRSLSARFNPDIPGENQDERKQMCSFLTYLMTVIEEQNEVGALLNRWDQARATVNALKETQTVQADTLHQPPSAAKKLESMLEWREGMSVEEKLESIRRVLLILIRGIRSKT